MAAEKQNPLVSVVVPVYNVERYIARCIESILNQTHQNLELILVDDGSPDRSGVICDEYAAKDPRITVIHIPNGGVSNARNTGMECAKGEFLFFVDSDDWVEPDHISTLLPTGDEDLVYGGRKMFRNAALFTEIVPPEYVAVREEWTLNYEDFLKRGLNLFFIQPCYRLDLIRKNNVKFITTLHCGEDGTFNVTLLKYCNKIRYSPTSTYCYEDGDGQMLTLSSRFRPQQIESVTICSKALEDMTQKNEYRVRWRGWHSIFRHNRKWLTYHNGIHRKEARAAINRAYSIQYFRECIPYIRQTGTLDEKVETYFMRKWLYPLYKPVYGAICLLSRVKKLVVRK